MGKIPLEISLLQAEQTSTTLPISPCMTDAPVH